MLVFFCLQLYLALNKLTYLVSIRATSYRVASNIGQFFSIFWSILEILKIDSEIAEIIVKLRERVMER